MNTIIEKVKFYHSLWFRLCISVFICTSLIVFGISWYLNCQTQAIMKKSVSDVVERLNEETGNRITALLKGVEDTAEGLKRDIEAGHSSKEEILRTMTDMLTINPELFYGSSVSFRPGGYYGTNMAFYCYWNKDELVKTNLNSPDYNYPTRDWFTKPQKMGKAVWSEPYYDRGGGNVHMCTYSVPFYETKADSSKEFLGVVTVDMWLAAVQKIINDVRVYETGYALLVSAGGEILAGAGLEKDLQDKDKPKGWKNPGSKIDLEALSKIVKSGRYGRIDDFIPWSGKPVWLYRSNVEKSGWSILFVLSEAEVLDDLDDVKKVAIHSFFGGLVVLLGMVIWISLRFTKPIVSLAAETDEIAKGNLNITPRRSGRKDEIGLLASSIDGMRISLKDYIASLGKSLVRQEHITSELKIAKNIQMSFLVQNFSIPGVDNVCIHAILEPAKEVGGDLYTFFRMDSKRLFFAVGDVSGKGVPAALFMAVTLTLMKGMQHQKTTPAGVLKRVGHELSLQNKHTMFVTVFCGILDTETGVLEYSNAGHLPPILLNPEGGARWLKLPPGLVLGVVTYPIFEDRKIQLKAGESLVVYTDGVNEAMNPAQELFGEERLMNVAKNLGRKDVSEVTHSICDAVHKYAGAEPQSDDITVFALKFEGSKDDKKQEAK